MRLHASCAARQSPDGDDALLLLGPAGAGKSDLLLRLIHRGFMLVADDQVLMEAGIARAPAPLAGLLEVRGLGIFRLPYLPQARLRLVIALGVQPERLPLPRRHAALDLPEITLDPALASAPERAALALDAACGRVPQLVGAFSA
ncbi:HPr kinase/phosphorylase [Acidocella sp. KAb 2-4]|uniref:HPr kinase/phosphorylase n=1 Tax=Acidocella sp. KAb 2-4 TaxID=2885158 RepID=UPI001D075794|nr:aldolase [Acidocella sp. KAb 2-4]MCB5944791.1 aldolase [Acidocella sp. KAb 2-4]